MQLKQKVTFKRAVPCTGSAILALIIAALWGPSALSAAVLFDSITNDNGGFVTNAPHTFMGQALNLADPGSGAPVQLTSMSVALASSTTTNYSDVQLNVQFWDNASDATAGTTPAFSNPVGSPITFDLGALDAMANYVYQVNPPDFSSANPIILSSLNNVGITLNWEGDIGSGLQSTDNLSTDVFVGPLTVGSDPLAGGNGYYRNASGETDFNFLGSDYRTINVSTSESPSTLALQLSGISLPEPGCLLIMLIPMLGLSRRPKGSRSF